ncbi:MAG: hypothetical protein ACR2NN_17860 [Bryobacteraceae bacterium]
MAEEIDPSGMRAPRKGPKVVRIGLLSSSAATAALVLTYCTGNRYVGFGRTISETEQSLLLLLAISLLVGFGVVNLLSRWHARQTANSKQDGQGI